MYPREIPSFTVSPFSPPPCPPRALSGLFEDVPGRISHQTERFSPQITLVPALFDSFLLEFSLPLFLVLLEKKIGTPLS